MINIFIIFFISLAYSKAIDKNCFDLNNNFTVVKNGDNSILKVTGEGIMASVIQEMLVILKYPLILIILFINIKLMYVMAPDKEIPSNTTNKGALFTTICWILATEIFAFYIDRFAKYDIFYGSISNMLVLLLWVYLLSYIFVFGMIINASNYKDFD